MNRPVIVCFSIVVAAITFIFGLVIGNMIPGGALGQDSLSAWVSALSSIVVCVLTIILAVETWRLRAIQSKQIDDMRRESIQPNISVELVPNRVGVNFMDVSVRNHGKGIARKVKFVFLDREGAVLGTTEDPLILQFRKLAIFRLGIESIGIGHELKTFLFSFFELGAKVEGRIFDFFLTLRVDYQDVEGRGYSDIFPIDFAQYEGFGTLGDDPLNQIAKELKSIKELMPKITNGRVGVNVFDSTDRNKEVDAGWSQRAEFRRRHEQG